MGSEKRRSITIAIYNHPELYPPVLNAIDELSTQFTDIGVVCRNQMISRWKYPTQVKLTASGEFLPVRASEQASTVWKVKSFVRFTRDFYKTVKHSGPFWVMCNDPISLFAFRLIRPFLGFPLKLWYHNHDVVEMKTMRRFSVGYFALKSEKTYFSHIDLFTLPSNERLVYFPMHRFKGKYLIVPNYPSLTRTVKASLREEKSEAVMKLVYQGRINDEHGLKEMVSFIKEDKSLRLTILGPGDPVFISELKKQAEMAGVSDRVAILDAVPYSELSEITAAHQVGLAINPPMNINYATAVRASNKIYEYAAAGLPIIYFQDEHYVQSLSEFRWAFPTDLSLTGLAGIISKIRLNYMELSKAAREDFEGHLNFDAGFKPVLSYLSNNFSAKE